MLFLFAGNLNGQEICNDGIDNDGDCNVDCDDLNCGTTNQSFSNGQAADFVVGQINYTSNSASTSDSTFNQTYDIARDPVSGKVFVSDIGNHRVLRYASIDAFLYVKKAECVFGQNNFTSSSSGTSATTLDNPAGIFVDHNGVLWVTDWGNNRVLRYDDAANKTSGASADGVLGQSDFTSNGSATSQNGMTRPIDCVVDLSGNLWVADQSNSRVLRFDNAASKSNGANADGVLGKSNYTSTGTSASQSNLGGTTGIALICDRLFVTDHSNDRILWWDNPASKSNGANADGVLGQSNFTSSGDGTSQTEFSGPRLLTNDDRNNFYVNDADNNRVLVFDEVIAKSNNAPADLVLGQSNFTSSSAATTQTSLNWPRGIGIIENGFRSYLAIGDRQNHRFLVWGVKEQQTDELTNFSSVLDGSDPSGSGGLTFAITAQPSVGSVVLDNASTGAFTYYPEGACPLNGDSVITFQYSISNNNGCSTTGELAINVTNIDDCPETCNNGIDDNGDGRVDEPYPGATEENLILWLKADEGFGGSSWIDQSTQNNDASFVGDPSAISSGSNHNVAIDFDGDDAVFADLPELVFDGSDNHVVLFMVYKPDNSSTTIGLLGNQVVGGSNNININNGQSSNGGASGPNTSNYLYNDESYLLRLVIDEENLVSGASNGSSISLSGAVQQSFDFDETDPANVNSDFYFGSSGTAGSSQFFDGSISEIIIYHSTDGNEAISSTNTQKVESYLSLKYGFNATLNITGTN